MPALKVDGITLNTLRLSGIGDHVDVDLTGLADNEVLAFDLASGNWLPEAGPPPGPHDLTSHTDVTLTAPSAGDVVRFDGALWINVAADDPAAHAASHMLGGSDPVTSFDNLTAELNLGGNNITNIATVKLTGGLVGKISTSGTLTISGGSSAILGGNILLRGEAATDANDIDLRSGTTVRLRWDNSVPEWNFQGLNIANVGNLAGTLTTAAQTNITSLGNLTSLLVSNLLTASGDIVQGTINADLVLSGGSTAILGANIRLFGQTASPAFDIEFRSSTTIRLNWDESALNWNFQSRNVIGMGAVTATSFAGIGTGLTALNASNITSGTLASAHISGSYTGITAVGNLTDLTVSNLLTAAGDIVRGVINNDLVISGGSTAILGANIRLFGQSASPANDIEFRTGTTVRLRWDNSVPEWNFQGLNVNNIGTLTFADITLTGTAGIRRNVGTSFLALSGGTSSSLGGNIILRGQTESPADDIEFRTDTTIRLNWDQSASNWNFRSRNVIGMQAVTVNSIAGIGTGLTALNASNLGSGTVPSARISGAYTGITAVGNLTSLLVSNLLTASGDIVRGVVNNDLIISGGSTASLGANIRLFGQSASPADDIQFRTDTTIRLNWDQSALNWNFQSRNVIGVAALTVTSIAGIGTGLTALNASNITSGTLASAHISGAYTGITAVGNLTDLLVSNLLTASGDIVRGVINNDLVISGGSTAILGANMRLFGQSASPANDLEFRTGTIVRLRWDNSAPDWNFQGLNIANVGNLAGTLTTAAQTNITSVGNLTSLLVSNLLTAAGDIVRGVVNNDLIVSGGSTAALGGTIRLFGQSSTPANGIQFREGANVRMEMVAAENAWDVSGQIGSKQQTKGVSASTNPLVLSCRDAQSWTLDNTGTPTIRVDFSRSGFLYVLKVTAKSGAGSGWNWPSTFRWRDGTKPVMTTTAERDDIITFYRDGTDDEFIASASLNHF